MKVNKNNGILSFTDELGNIATVSLINGEMQEYKSNKGKWFPRKSLTYFFKGLDAYEFKNWDFEDEKLELFFEYLANNYSTCNNIGTFVKRMKENEKAEILIKMGFKFYEYQIYDISLDTINKIPKDIRKWFINNKIFPKNAINNICSKINQDVIRNLILLKDDNFAKNMICGFWFKRSWEGFKKDIYITNIEYLIVKYHLEIKRLISYIYYLYNSENIRELSTIFEVLEDYLNMSQIVYKK